MYLVVLFLCNKLHKHISTFQHLTQKDIAHNSVAQLGCIFEQVRGFLPCKTTIQEDNDQQCHLEPCFWLVVMVDFHGDALTRLSGTK